MLFALISAAPKCLANLQRMLGDMGHFSIYVCALGLRV
jgi:hypothetical protein